MKTIVYTIAATLFLAVALLVIYQQLNQAVMR